jgi:hypothetical protein
MEEQKLCPYIRTIILSTLGNQIMLKIIFYTSVDMGSERTRCLTGCPWRWRRPWGRMRGEARPDQVVDSQPLEHLPAALVDVAGMLRIWNICKISSLPLNNKITRTMRVEYWAVMALEQYTTKWTNCRNIIGYVSIKEVKHTMNISINGLC